MVRRQVPKPDKVDLGELFADLQNRMRAGLAGSRRSIKHPTASGQASELNWQKMLSEHLPARYRVTTGFVVDHEGTLSEQIDVVIFDRQYTPFLLNRDGTHYIPAEGVYAVFEARQDLSKRNLEYAAKKAKSVRDLKRTSVAITHAGGVFDAPPLIPILAGMLTLDSDWRPALGNAFSTVIGGLDEPSQIDLGCSLRHGSFEVSYDADRPTIQLSSEARSLIFFFLRLLARLQGAGTVRAMDFRQYSKWLDD